MIPRLPDFNIVLQRLGAGVGIGPASCRGGPREFKISRLPDINIVLESLGANVGIGAAWGAGDVQISKTHVLQGFGLDSVLPGSRTPYKPNAFQTKFAKR